MQDYLGEILKYWELSDRELDGVCDAISLGLEDASAKAREFARVAYMQLKTKYSKRADRLKAHLQVPIRAKLAKMEDEHDAAEQKKMMSSAQSVRCEEPVEPKAPPEVAISAVVALQALVRGSITRQSMSASDLTQERKPVASAAASLFRRVAVTEDHHGSQTAAVVPHIHKTIVPPSSHIKPNSAQAPHSNDHVNSSSSLVIPHINTSVALTSTQPPRYAPLSIFRYLLT